MAKFELNSAGNWAGRIGRSHFLVKPEDWNDFVSCTTTVNTYKAAGLTMAEVKDGKVSIGMPVDKAALLNEVLNKSEDGDE